MPANIIIWRDANVSSHGRSRLALARKVEYRTRGMLGVMFGTGNFQRNIQPAKDFDKVGGHEERRLEFVVGCTLYDVSWSDGGCEREGAAYVSVKDVVEHEQLAMVYERERTLPDALNTRPVLYSVQV